MSFIQGLEVAKIAKDPGKLFEEDIEKSSTKIFGLRIKDTPQIMLKRGARVSRNKYDYLLYYFPHLFPMEFKSTKAKSISYDGANPKIKPHQIKSLEYDNQFKGVYCGFLFNFREPQNLTYFLHIDQFNRYREENPDKKSIPLSSVQELGVELRGVKKRTRYTYFVKELLENIIKEYEEG